MIVPCAPGPAAIQPGVLEAIRAGGHEPDIYALPGPTAYFELLAGLWNRTGQDIVIVEQDIVVRPECIGEMLACDHDWCKFPYHYPPFGFYGGLGCTKFSAFLQHWVPDALEVVATMSDAGHPPKHWCRLDAWLQDVLIKRGEREHFHGPPVQHLNVQADNRCELGLRTHDDIGVTA